jgi:class 3 adenylate cyclase
MDPEALRALLRDYQAVCVESVVRFGGTIHQYAGDGVLSYFGYPAAHDNDPERAILAGLAIVASVRRLTDERRVRGEVGFSARIGIHTGLVVIGEMGAGGAREIHAIGETPNIAARIQSEAAPDSVCISAATLRLAGRRFQVRALGPRPLKGVAKDLELFSVDAAMQLDAGSAAVSAPAPLVGRDRELHHLLESWGLAKAGRGQAVLVSGEGGIGKSRLLAAFRERADVHVGAWRNIFCSPFYQNSALQPMIDLIERAIQRSARGADTDRAAALRRIMDDSELADEMTFALVASLLGLGSEHEHVLRDLEPDQRKRRTLDALVAWLHADSRRHPLVLVVEDLHWIDATTRDLLGMLLERIASFRFSPS